MSSSITIAAGVVAFLFLCTFIPGEVHKRFEERNRAELWMLDGIRHGIEAHRKPDTPVPNTWESLSNVVGRESWKTVNRMPQGGFIPVVTQMYTVLDEPVSTVDRDTPGLIFLVRSKPTGSWGNSRGRWVLVATSNRVFRTWFPEKYLPPEIRSQLQKKGE